MTEQTTSFQQTIDFSRLLKPIIRYWYLIALFVLMSILAALYYVRRLTPLYEMQATILVRNNEEDGLTKDALQKEILGMGTNPKIYEDVRIIRSRICMEAIIDSLNLRYRLLEKEPFGEKDLYATGPIDLSTLIVPDRPATYSLKILTPSIYRIQLNESDRVEGVFGVPLNTNGDTFVLNLKQEASGTLDTTAHYVLEIQSIEGSAKSLLNAFSVDYNTSEPTILDLHILDEVPQRGMDILNKSVQTYNRLALDDKSRKRKNTLDFIEERINVLVTELNQVELDLERYKTNESLTIDYKADLPFIQDRIGYFEREIVDAEIQQDIMEYIAESLDSMDYQFFPLVDFGMDHQGLSSLIHAYNNLIQERSKLRQTVTENYPSIQLIDEKIQSLRISIQEELAKSLQEQEARVNELRNKNRTYLAELNATPRRERELVNKQRQQITKENLYKYLLEKREEAAVSIAAVGENARMIDPPFMKGQVAPKQNSILLGAALAGFMLPFSALFLFSLIDSRIRYKEDLSGTEELPLLGSIYKAKTNNKLVMQPDDHTAAAESFRSLRTNLDIFLKEHSDRLVVVTSASIEEGKSFTSVNLGMSYALSGKNTLLIDCDLRKPTVPLYLGVSPSNAGLTEYLSGTSSLTEVIQEYEPNPHLHYITRGAQVANPSELLMSDRLPILLEELKKQYDWIILDSPAVGLVSDALLLSGFANASLLVIRAGTTRREDLDMLRQLKTEGKITNPALVFNGVRKGRTYEKAIRKGYYKN